MALTWDEKALTMAVGNPAGEADNADQSGTRNTAVKAAADGTRRVMNRSARGDGRENQVGLCD
jgi:hypothetical protein